MLYERASVCTALQVHSKFGNLAGLWYVKWEQRKEDQRVDEYKTFIVRIKPKSERESTQKTLNTSVKLASKGWWDVSILWILFLSVDISADVPDTTTFQNCQTSQTPKILPLKKCVTQNRLSIKTNQTFKQSKANQIIQVTLQVVAWYNIPPPVYKSAWLANSNSIHGTTSYSLRTQLRKPKLIKPKRIGNKNFPFQSFKPQFPSQKTSCQPFLNSESKLLWIYQYQPLLLYCLASFRSYHEPSGSTMCTFREALAHKAKEIK